ncbi:RelE/StbE family addiction module toxin [Nitrosomonas sp. PY1]|uniref:type II toxin-antitoxin system RelE family toxin n=1 Tax=Nitrosomonas sp. PY1 TaxID=1803906 RepID=UPI001FC7D909|nr:type II toxin-antitoxin system RelE/ParE family toxin [Nitrosomonas sp. PY1]GKS68580.1 RelE/StbE family addiction module toxin [Nitrosomonas sp. PY1]
MEKYNITFKRSVTKDFISIPKQDVMRILDKIESLSDNPRSEGAIKIAGKELYRIRQGTYRIVYEIFDRYLIVNVIKIGHRSNVYDSLLISQKIDGQKI